MSQENTTTTTAKDTQELPLQVGTAVVNVLAREVKRKGKTVTVLDFAIKTRGQLDDVIDALLTVEGHNEETVMAWLNRSAFAPLGREIAEVGTKTTEGVKVEIGPDGQPKIGPDGKPVVVIGADGKPVKEAVVEFDPDLASAAIGEELQPPSRKPGGGSEAELNKLYNEIAAEALALYKAQIAGKATDNDRARIVQLDLQLADIQTKLTGMAKAKAERAEKKAAKEKEKAAAAKAPAAPAK